MSIIRMTKMTSNPLMTNLRIMQAAKVKPNLMTKATEKKDEKWEDK